MQPHTLTELANLSAEALGRRPSEYMQFHRTCRNWWVKGLLRAADLEGHDSEPARFDDFTVCKVPFFAALSDMGHDIRTLRDADKAMDSFVEAQKLDGATLSKRGIEVAMDGIRRGENWFLHLSLAETGNGIWSIVGGFRSIPEDDLTPTAARIIAAHDSATGRRNRTHLILPANELLVPLIARLDADRAD